MQEGREQGGLGAGRRKGDTVTATGNWALVVVAVAVNELTRKEEEVAEDLTTAMKIAKKKDPPYYP